MQLELVEEGSSKTSPATISKVPGTSISSSSSSSTSSSSGSSITELGGGPGDGGLFDLGGGSASSTSHVSTKTVTCTKSIRRTVVHTKDGPVEKVEEVMEGGPECQVMTNLGNGGMSALFPGVSQASSTSSFTSSGTKTFHTSSTKTGSADPIPDPFGDVGFDLGGFTSDNAEADLPDFHARSVKSTRVERQADYVGKGTETSDVE